MKKTYRLCTEKWNGIFNNLKVKLSPKCNLHFFCECVWLKSSCKNISTTKQALLFSFIQVKLIYQCECKGHFYASITITIFKHWEGSTQHGTCSQSHQGLYTWTRALRTLFVYTEFAKNKVFLTTHLSSSLFRSQSSWQPRSIDLRMQCNMEESY